jgi:hypothetical protein
MILDPRYVPIFGPPEAPAPTLYHYFNQLALRLGGVNVWAARLVPALLGTGTVAMFYFLARRMFSRPVALALLAIFAVMRWNVNFSRINFIGAATPFFGTAAIYFLLRGVETKNRWHMALSGLAVSLGLYTYYASNLVPFVLGPYLVLQLAWDRKFLREQWDGVLLFLGVALAVFAPLGHFSLTHQDQFFARNGQVLIFNHVPPEQAAKALWTNIKTTLLMFNYYGDCNGRHNIPEVPMLDYTTGILFGLGLFTCLKNIHRPHAFLTLLWFLIALVPGFLTIEAPQGYRCIGAIVPVALLAGFGLESFWQGLGGMIKEIPAKRWLWGGLLVLVVWIGYRNLNDYFEQQAQHVACWSEFSAREAAIGQRLGELGGQYHAYISSGSYDYPSIKFLAYPWLEAEPFSMITSIPGNYHGEKNLIYCLLPIHENTRELLTYYYPGGRGQTHTSPYDFTIFFEYVIPSEELQRSRGLMGEYHNRNGAEAHREDGAVSLMIGPGQAPLSGQVTVHWQGSLSAPAWDKYFFRLDQAHWSRVRVDQQEVSHQGIELAQGLHTFDLQAEFPAEQGLRVEWKRQSSFAWQVIPGFCLLKQTHVHGLKGTYFANADWQGTPFTKRIDPFLSLLGADFPLAAPFSARWEGTLHAPKTGGYILSTLNNQFSWVYVDGREILANTTADGCLEAPVRLTQGPHALRVDYQKKEGSYPTLILYWARPGQPKEKIPFSVLEP